MQTPQNLQIIMDGFMLGRYGDTYKNGVLHAGKDFLKSEFSDSDKINYKNKNTAFFLEKNPNYMVGDELICITQITLQNLNKAGGKMLGV